MLSLVDTAMELLREDKMKIKNMLIIACSCFLMAGCTQTGTDAIDTMENQAGDVSVSLGMDQAAVEKNLGTGTQLDATEDPQMETISYGEGADYLVVIYQEGKVISLGTYWEDLEDLNAGTDTSTPDQDSKWQTTEGIARGAALEDLQMAYPDGKYLAKNSSPEDGTSRLRIFSRQRERPAA